MDLLQYFDQSSMMALKARRHHLSTVVRRHFDSVTHYGILKGFRVPQSEWAELVSSAYILGTYEVAVCAILDTLKGGDRTFVDLGGADGVFGVGLVEVGAFGAGVVFELDSNRRQAITDMVTERGLSGKVAIHGEATAQFPDVIVQKGTDLAECVVLCDIEGAEFTLFQDDLLRRLSDCHVIIELHDFLLNDPVARETAVGTLMRAAERYFDVHVVKDGLRDIRNIPPLCDLSDWDSYLLCVEARYRMMSWLWLRPRREGPLSSKDIDAIVLDYQRRIFAE